MTRLRATSLFWKLTGSFLLVLVLAIILQGVVAIMIIEPIARRAAKQRADTLLVSTAVEIADVFAAIDPGTRRAHPRRLDAEIAAVLRAHRLEAGPLVLQFRHRDGRAVGMRLGPPGWGRGPRPGMGPGWRLRRDGGGGPSGAPPPGRESAEAWPPAFPPGADGGDGTIRPPGEAGVPLRPLSRVAVTAGADTLGHLVALTGPRRLFFLPADVPGSILLFFPIAILLAGGAGVLTFRSLTRRLRTLESLAARVAEGDLAARVPAPAADEIGRLGAALNRMAERLASARDRATEGERQRAQLLADISHELATPMTSIRGFAETLLDPSVSLSEQERLEYLRSVVEEAKRLDLLIQDLFELNRMEAGALPLALERLDWAALCRNTMRRFEPRFRAAGLALRWAGPDDEAWITADGRRMEQVLENLLVNALRYVPSGGTVTAALDAGPADGTLRLSVSDDGPGIAPKDLPHIFERFYRADEARASGGTGLGLAIVRQIVLQHGGAVRAETRLPHGTTFVVDLPLA